MEPRRILKTHPTSEYSALRGGIRWDEETIAEHDKVREQFALRSVVTGVLSSF